ncbi:MAG: adenylate cyclase [Deferribacterota bacterium]|nr:adenylate cyclase [Deferribacterota bacterium]
MLEIEKKYLVKNIPLDLRKYECIDIVQGYIAVEEGFSEVRVRIGKKHSLTVKSYHTNYRFEKELLVSKKDSLELMKFCSSRTVSKKRYIIPYDDYVIELDIYKGKLEGLIIAEVEFKSEEELLRFKKPDWFEKDVTDDKRYKNKNLAIYGL